MKIKKGIGYCAFVLSLILFISACFYLGEHTGQYMDKESAEQQVNNEFGSCLESILQAVGSEANFFDKYGKDDENVENTEYTVKELKQLYDTTADIASIYRERLEAIKMYYLQRDDYTYDDDRYDYDYEYLMEQVNINDLFSKDDFDENNHIKTESFLKKQKEYQTMIEFFDYYAALRDNSFYLMNDKNSNIGVYISYTNTDNEKITHSNGVSLSELEGNDLHSKRKYNERYFVYDKAKDIFTFEGFAGQNHYYSYTLQQCRSFTDYDDMYVRVAIDTNFVGENNYNEIQHYLKDVITDEKQVKEYYSNILVLGISLLGMLLSTIALMLFTGHKTKKDSPQIYAFDRLWWDIEVIAVLILGSISVIVASEFTNVRYFDMNITIGVCILAAAAVCLEGILSITRRIKAKQLWATSLTGRVWKKASSIFKVAWSNLTITNKTITCCMAIFVLCFVNGLIFRGSYYDSSFILWLFITIIEIGVVAVFIWKFLYEYARVEEETRKIADGEINHKIDFRIFFKQNKDLAEDINNIGQGISKAVEQSVKNERMKTDLITNVSHDIKTPLTSIINYVDLLKSEDIENEKVKGYIDILDAKSQRLKVLTDDLVEASKLSSGTIVMDFSKLNIVELIKQSAGEYDEKFAEKNLTLITNLTDKPIYIWGDGRKMWRVLENLYNNIYKYALEGTRVYVDLVNKRGQVEITVKNISENPLNFNSDELTERFIRGDVSRSTEGSGLGLSIAKSIVRSHNGDFKVVFDGDLFKIVILLKEYKEENISVDFKEV